MTLQSMTTELIKSGLTEAALAALAGCSQPTINRIKRGAIANPSYSVGDALRRLHAERCSPRAA